MEIEFVNKMFKYIYTKGDGEVYVEYALLYVPKNASFNHNKSLLYQQRNEVRKHPYRYHEIDIHSVEDLTIT